MDSHTQLGCDVVQVVLFLGVPQTVAAVLYKCALFRQILIICKCAHPCYWKRLFPAVRQAWKVGRVQTEPSTFQLRKNITPVRFLFICSQNVEKLRPVSAGMVCALAKLVAIII